MQSIVLSFLYWTVLILMVPGVLAFLVWIWAAIRLRKPWQLVAALLFAATYGCCFWGIRSLHQDRMQHRHHPEQSVALSKLILALGLSAMLLVVLMPKRQGFMPNNSGSGDAPSERVT